MRRSADIKQTDYGAPRCCRFSFCDISNKKEKVPDGYFSFLAPVTGLPYAAAKPAVNAPYEPTEPHPEPVPRKIRKSGTGCIYQINDHLWEGSFFPRLPSGKRKKFNVYTETRDQCEAKLSEMIERVKAEIAEEKAMQK